MEAIIVREGLSAITQIVEYCSNSVSLSSDNSNVEIKYQTEGKDLILAIPLWYVIMIVGSMLCSLLSATMSYYVNNVYATVMLVEDENNQNALPETEPQQNEKAMDMEKTPLVGQNKLITTSWRNTAKFLVARSGFRSCYRGARLASLKMAAATVCCLVLNSFIARNPQVVAAKIVANPYVYTTLVTLITSPYSVAWVYYVISDRGQGPIASFIPTFATVRDLVSPTMAVAVIQTWSVYLPIQAAHMFGHSPRLFNFSKVELAVALGWLVLYHINSVGFQLLLVRVYASTTPEHIRTIVPVDRSFGTGKETSEPIGLLQARIFMSNGLFKRMLKSVAVSSLFQLFNLMIVAFSLWNNYVNVWTPLVAEAVSSSDGTPYVSDMFSW